ncbi:hypothetical protein FFK22_040890 [Mycobacterium sp. KBS0706]|uniref:hypothetical protein n=1 Tax=Mycobacterium sp. KBS0706 TaxID=2578109 RepID=UPI00110FD7BD|nr:hypothetical protein [Mycobacterium sp. KBS0706]TSD82855.1 hypothetical protein FFK22_040890 [Mycobacterium sp. KBS0706]
MPWRASGLELLVETRRSVLSTIEPSNAAWGAVADRSDDQVDVLKDEADLLKATTAAAPACPAEPSRSSPDVVTPPAGLECRDRCGLWPRSNRVSQAGRTATQSARHHNAHAGATTDRGSIMKYRAIISSGRPRSTNAARAAPLIGQAPPTKQPFRDSAWRTPS